MPADDPIILDPPRKAPAISVKPSGFDSLKNTLKKYSTYAWGLVAAAPDLYNNVSSLGHVPGSFQKGLWGLAALGFVVTWIRQKRHDAT